MVRTRRKRSAAKSARPDYRRLAVALLLVAVVGWQIVVGLVAPLLMTAGRFDLAAQIAPDSALVRYLVGREALARGDFRASNAAFRASLARAPLDQSALTMLAIGEPPRTAAVMNQSAALGWRDIATQRWLAEAASDPTLFATRYDAYARQTNEGETAGVLLDDRIADPRVRAAIVTRLALEPVWRGTYLSSLPRPDPALVSARLALFSDLRRAGSPPTARNLAEFAARLRHFGLEADARAVESGR